jgi:hypothetical protein
MQSRADAERTQCDSMQLQHSPNCPPYLDDLFLYLAREQCDDNSSRYRSSLKQKNLLFSERHDPQQTDGETK